MRQLKKKISSGTYSASTIISKYQSNTTLSTKLWYAKDGHKLLSALIQKFIIWWREDSNCSNEQRMLEVMLCQFLGPGFKRSFHFLQTLAVGTQPLCCAMSKTHEEAILQALQSTSQLNSQPTSTAIHGNEPSWMFCPAEFSEDSNPSWILDYKYKKPSLGSNQLNPVGPRNMR